MNATVKPLWRPLCACCGRKADEHILPLSERRCPDNSGTSYLAGKAPKPSAHRRISTSFSAEEVEGLNRLLTLVRTGGDARVLVGTTVMVHLQEKILAMHERLRAQKAGKP